MDITFLGATETVTGSKYLLSFDNRKILVDCGLYQGRKDLRLRNWNRLPIDPATIDTVLLTHAHIDHTGYLPLLIKNGFRGTVYSTEGTKDLCSILLPDSGHLQEEEAEIANKYGYSKHAPAFPLYTQKEGEEALNYFDTIAFNQQVNLTDEFSFLFLPAGHIIGSSFIRIQHKDYSLLFTGDMGRLHDPVMKAPTVIHDIDYLVVESTYGNRLHEPGHPKDYLKDIINKTVQRGGTVVIPSFAVGRAQAMLHYLYLLKKEKSIPDIPVFLDSPMAVNATHIFLKHIENLRLNEDECRQLNDIATYVNTPEESKELDNNPFPKIIISASGMATGGRVLFHIKAYGGDSKNTILFTGYQAEGTRGDRMVKGEKEIKIHGAMVQIQAQVESLSNTSAHSDYEETLTWLSFYKKAPQKVFITHGELAAANSLKEKIEQQFAWSCVVPHYLQKETLS
ncbi:MBL fold metallo-hydrolase RNA specificity domain-containing protein [Fluoribacter gormanii]|uniref:MBL fold metallo-hydrolase RNA specificity domain-containing protein n=1 Tax=Fluoribacter gormanii TaxID=464 RepID=UPI0010413B4D|nr:MBL fold metallo-hydrolase [Fluoribacter gormanii]